MFMNRIAAFRLSLVLGWAGLAVATSQAAEPLGAAGALKPAEVLERLRGDGDLERAKTDLMRGLLAEPGRQNSLFNLGAIAERERDWEAAIDFYERAAKAAPRTPTARLASERLLAVRRIAALSVTPGGREQMSYEIGLARASQALGQGRSAEAIGILDSAMRTSPERWEGLAMTGAILAGENRKQEAAGFLRAARRNAPPADTARFDRAIEALLAPSLHLFDAALASGPRRAADVQRAARQTLEPRGGEHIKEASALLVARDVDGAASVLAQALSTSASEAPLAWRMLRELAPVSELARDYVATTSEPLAPSAPVASAHLEDFLRDAVTEDARRIAAAPPVLLEERGSVSTTAAALAPAPAPAPAPTAAAPLTQPTPAPVAPSCPDAVAAAAASARAGVVIQVAAYREARGAEALARKLVSRGFDARARMEGPVYRVIVGPFPSERAAAEVREQLARDGFSGFVRAQAGD